MKSEEKKMIDKFAVSCMTTYYKAKGKITKLCKAEDGMETIETVILIAIAVIVAGFVVNFLTRGQFGEEGNNQGLIGYIFRRVGTAITGMFTDGNMSQNVDVPTSE